MRTLPSARSSSMKAATIDAVDGADGIDQPLVVLGLDAEFSDHPLGEDEARDAARRR